MTTGTNLQPPPLPKGADEAFCSSCGNPIKLKAEVCPNCGVRQRKGANKTALALLTFFLGGLGAHKFYADPNNTHVPSLEELASTTGFQIDHRIRLYLEGNEDRILIRAAHKTATCQKGESYVRSTDDVYGEWQ